MTPLDEEQQHASVRWPHSDNLEVYGLVAAGALVALAILASAFPASREYGWIGLLFIGFAFVAMGVGPLMRAASVRRWPRAHARVIRTEVGDVNVSLGVQYFPVVSFEYLVDGRTFQSNRFTIAGGDYRRWRKPDAQAIADEYHTGQMVEISYSPQDPSIAVLRSTVSWPRRSHYWACVVAGLIIVGVALLTGALTLR